MKLRTRIMIAFLIIGALAFSYLLLRVDQTARPVYLETIEDDLVELATLLSSLITLDPESGRLDIAPIEALLTRAKGRELRAKIYHRLKTSLDFRVYVADRNGEVIYDSDQGAAVGENYMTWNDVSLTLAGEYGARASWSQTEAGRILVLHVASPILIDGEILGVVTVAKPTPVAYSFYNKVRFEAFLGVSIAALLVLIGGMFITAWITRPIRALTDYAQAVRDGRRAELPALPKSDIARLGEAFEEMRDALEGKNYVEQYVQTLTHEIKSPLSAIHGASELLQEDMPAERRAAFLANIKSETARIQRLVDRLLELSSIESRKTPRNQEDVELRALVEEIVAGARPRWESKNLRLQIQSDKKRFQRGERFLLRLAISNLLQNAIEHTPNGGRIEISLEPERLRIADSGPGVPDFARDRVFERFYSLRNPESGRKSSGLGLSIVKQVAELHGFQVSLRNRPEGGAEAILQFHGPAA